MSQPIKTGEEYTIETPNRKFYLSLDAHKSGRVGATLQYSDDGIIQTVVLDVGSETIEDIIEALRLSLPILKDAEKKNMEARA